MPVRLTIRVAADDRVQVNVEGLIAQDAAKAPDAKTCRKLTRRLEEDLGAVSDRQYEQAPPVGEVELTPDNTIDLQE